MNMSTETVIAIIGAVMASSGLWGLIQYLINRKDSTLQRGELNGKNN